ncbi:MFS transporter [Streptomyces sp. NPDC005805]|uniref:MFS transporter n=1 Tax=Streptomyces sp. NPDC005805 TaxID=3157068 RepID=UPI0033F0D11C
MLTLSSCPPDARLRRLERRLCLYSGLEDFVLLYPLYALLFADHGLTTAEISSLFALWSLAGLVLEVPSGVLADVLSRRLLLIAGPLLTATGFTLWFTVPSYGTFAAGFVLWGVGGALRSGAYEALAHDELERLGAASRYARVMGRATAWAMVAVAVSTAAAAPVLAVGGLPAIAVASVGACLLCAAAGAALPEHRGGARSGSDPGDAADVGAPGPVATLRAGLGDVRRSRPVRRALLLSIAVTSVWGALDEYVPLLAASTGVAATTVPLLALVVWSGLTAGSLLVGRAEGMRSRSLGLLLAGGAAATALGALSGHPAGFVAVAAGFLVFQLADVLADARLQAAITGPSRATVTSLAGLGTSVATLGTYGAYAGLSAQFGHGGVFALLALPYLGVALALFLRGRVRAVAPEDHVPDARPGAGREADHEPGPEGAAEAAPEPGPEDGPEAGPVVVVPEPGR